MKKKYYLLQLFFLSIFCSAHAMAVRINVNPSSCLEDDTLLNNVLVSEDAYVRNGSHVNTNFGAETTLVVKSTTNDNFVRESLMKFDLSAYVSITSAKLYFYGKAQVNMDLQVYAINDDSWSENTATWSNSPSLDVNLGSVQMTSSNAWRELDVTAGVQNSFNGNDKFFSIGLRDDDFIRKTITINSKENTQGLIPYLEIEGELINNQIIKRDIYLVIGQSNTAGRGAIESKDEVALTGVDLFNGSGWESATNPMNAYSTIRKDLDLQQLGYAYTFGRTVNEVTGNQLGMVVNSRGGTNIGQWTKGADDGFYEAALSQVTLALQTPGTTLKGILWHQGEGNRNDSNYISKLEVLINDFRSDLSMPNLPFIAGELSRERTDNENFNERIKQLPIEVTNTDYVSSAFLGTTDLTHFDSNAQRILGGRYAAKILEMVYGYELKTERVWIDEDVYVRGGGNSDVNYGDDTDVRVKELSSGIANNNTRRGLLKFNLSSISGSVIDANLFLNASVTNGTESMNVAFYATTTDWSENSVTMNSVPNFTDKLIVSTLEGKNIEEREIYLSEYIQEQNKQSNTVAIGLQSDNAGSEQLKITTKEDVINQDLRPYLLVSYIEENLSISSSLASAKSVNSQGVEDSLVEITYTNPVSDELKITHNSVFKNVTIYSISGQYILTQEVNDFSGIVNVAHLTAGTYVFEIEDAHQSISKIFIKQ